MGKKPSEEGDNKAESDSDSDSEPEDNQAIQQDDSQSENSDSDSESDSEEVKGGQDLLQSSHRLDIPVVRDIPVVSSLARKEKVKESQSKQTSVEDIMMADDTNVESHFVEIGRVHAEKLDC